MRPVCFFAGSGPCDGALVRAHVVPRQLLKREFPVGVAWCVLRECWVDARRWLAPLDDTGPRLRSLEALVRDPATWVPCCGGPMGLSGHHGMFDGYRLRLPRDRVPAETEAFAAELGLTWWLDRTYGEPIAGVGTPAGSAEVSGVAGGADRGVRGSGC